MFTETQKESVCYCELHAYPILDERGTVVRIIKYALDITDRELAKRSLLAVNDDLEKRVDERTAELCATNKRLLKEISERKRVEAELGKSEERIRAIFEGARDCVFVKDLSLRYALVNPAIESLLGVPAFQILGQKDTELYGREAGQYLEALDSRVLQGESVETEHTRMIHGSPVTFLETRVPMHDEDGIVIGLCGISRDITDRKEGQVDLTAVETGYLSPGYAEDVGQGPARCDNGLYRVAHGRERIRQGLSGLVHPQTFQAEQWTLSRDQLRCHSFGTRGIGAVWT